MLNPMLCYVFSTPYKNTSPPRSLRVAHRVLLPVEHQEGQGDLLLKRYLYNHSNLPRKFNI